ncbi:BglG family transcription antiterminator [Oenococcus sp.]|uniref:BglG family transcription antiterminator n=1 Tax=Oenococcus sp. TaxID=1979414 RepID=UPI0039ED7D11
MLEQRPLSLLVTILTNPDTTSTQLEDKFNLSHRQLNYAISKINLILRHQQLEPLKKLRTGRFELKPQSREYLIGHVGPLPATAINNLHRKSDKLDYFDELTRVKIIFILLASHPSGLRLHDITDFLKVSSNTFLKDIRQASKTLQEEKIEITHSRKFGYQIAGQEFQILGHLSQTVRDVLADSEGEIILDQIPGIEKSRTLNLVSTMERSLVISYSDTAFKLLTNLLRFVLAHMEHGESDDSLPKNVEVTESREYTFLKNTFSRQSWHINSQAFIEWLALAFLSANTIQNESLTSRPALIEAVQQMLNAFQNKTYIVIQNHSDFVRRLTEHMLPAIYRTKYGLKLNDINFEKLIEDPTQNDYLMNVVRDSVGPVEKLIGKKLPKDELQLIAFYLGSELGNYTDRVTLIKKKAAVVCANGLVFARLMINMLRDVFPEINFVSATSVRRFNEYQSDYDLVFTTTLLNTEIPQYIVNPVLTPEERSRLRFRVLTDIYPQSTDRDVKQILKMVHENADNVDESALKKTLTDYFLNYSNYSAPHQQRFKTLPAISSYVQPNFIQIARSPLSWIDAIKMACRPLVNGQIIQAAYVDQLIKQTRNDNNSTYLKNVIAIPHTVPEYGALGDGFGFLVAQDHFDFPGCSTIKIVVPIAIVHTDMHLRAVNQLVALSGNKGLLNEITNAGSELKIFQILNKLL